MKKNYFLQSKVFDSMLFVYKNTASFLLELLFGKGCRFTPTCSEYFTEASKRYGLVVGFKLFVKRILKCHPYSKAKLFDPVPQL